MKKIFSRSMILTMILLPVLIIGTTVVTSAKDPEGLLVEKLEQIVDLLTKNINEKENKKIEDIFLEMGGYSKNVYNPDCFDNYEEWPVSEHRKENAPWDTTQMISDFMTVGSSFNETQQFLDLNGDGLVDYLYFANSKNRLPDGYSSILSVDGQETNKSFKSSWSCIKLNNGQGWDNAFRCIATAKYIGTSSNGKSLYKPEFYGDCADVN